MAQQIGMVKTIAISLAILAAGILLLKKAEEKQVHCTGGQTKNDKGVCVCPTGQSLQDGTCKPTPKNNTPQCAANQVYDTVIKKCIPRNASDDEDDDDSEDGENGDECPASAENACAAQQRAYGANYTCEVNDTCTCVCQRKANRAVVNANRVLTNDYYNNRMDYYDYKNRLYMFDKDDDYRYKALPAFAENDNDPIYAFNPDGNTMPFFREGFGLTMNGNLRFANVTG